jgi:transcriptional antiterminator Rof (Rho-off)
MADYQPIPCIDHERLEFAVLRRQRLSLRWLDGQGLEREAVVLPTDVATRQGAEWLSYREADGPETELRLDRILSFGPA